MPKACWKRGKNPDVYELVVGKDPVTLRCLKTAECHVCEVDVTTTFDWEC